MSLKQAISRVGLYVKPPYVLCAVVNVLRRRQPYESAAVISNYSCKWYRATEKIVPCSINVYYIGFSFGIRVFITLLFLINWGGGQLPVFGFFCDPL